MNTGPRGAQYPDELTPGTNFESVAENARADISRLAGALHNTILRLSALRTIELASERSVAEQVRQRAMTATEQNADSSSLIGEQRRRALEDKLALAVATAAPGIAGQVSNEWSPKSISTGLPAAVRVGHLSGSDLPGLLKVTDSAGVAVDGADAAALVHELALRIALATPPGRLEFCVFDPTMTGSLGIFSALRASDTVAFAPSINDERLLRERLFAHLATVASTAESMAVSGASTFAELGKANSRPRYVFVVLLGYPAGFTEDTHARLVQLAHGSKARGVSFIVHVDDHVRPADRVETSDFLSLIPRASASGGVLSGNAVPAPYTLDTPAGRARWLDAVGWWSDVAVKSTAPVTSFEDIVNAIEDAWVEGADTAMVASFGRAGETVLGLEFRNANPPLPNALIGGAVGQGKSNLLLTLIYGVAARYSPDDVRMFLLDFKEGVEFSQLGPSGRNGAWLPHVDVLGLESDRDFGLAVLSHLTEQFEIRSTAFKNAGVGDITAFRSVSTEPMPRLLLVIDEFQVLFGRSDEVGRAAVDQLESLVRKGRAYGIHVVLASQSIRGIPGFSTRGDAIFAQIPHRISLKNSADESRAILGDRNTAAASLRVRGDVVVNSNFGEPSDNVVGSVAYADSRYLERLKNDLWRMSVDRVEPRVFVSSNYSPSRLLVAADRSGPALACLGVPIGVRTGAEGPAVSFDDEQNIALLGSSRELTHAVLNSIVLSLLIHPLFDGATVQIVDCAGDTFGSALAESWIEQGYSVEVVPKNSAMSTIVDGLEEPVGATRFRQIVVFLDLHRLRELSEQDERTFKTKSELFVRYVTESVDRGAFVVGCWSSARAAQTTVPRLRGFGATVSTGLVPAEYTAAFGPHTEPPEGFPRITYTDSVSVHRPRTLVPFDPSARPAVQR
ncbi:FtsK/SpoIIIE domain-containing protein [Rhodococcus sp. KRD162]|uniref:FtsK/SpoIIIE domain-containing protein n=1 Tax=Rhodococcus sp. KRD162 TaxID=2729725 RepID=UPI003CFEB220